MCTVLANHSWLQCLQTQFANRAMAAWQVSVAALPLLLQWMSQVQCLSCSGCCHPGLMLQPLNNSYEQLGKWCEVADSHASKANVLAHNAYLWPVVCQLAAPNGKPAHTCMNTKAFTHLHQLNGHKQ